jgi:hypothetical protein
VGRVKPQAGGNLGAQIPILQHKSVIILTPPVVPTLATTNIEIGEKLKEQWRWQTLGEDVGKLRSHRDMQNMNFSNGDLVTDKVEINPDMFHAMMLDEVGCQVDVIDIVAIDKCAAGQRGVQLHEMRLSTARYSSSALE